jgi:hypothetical protein
MARSALILIPVAMLLVGCQTIDKRASAAAAVQGQAKAQIPFPDLPEACTAKVGRVKPGDEPWVIVQKRWLITADNRDRQAEDCRAWGVDIKSKFGSR